MQFFLLAAIAMGARFHYLFICKQRAGRCYWEGLKTMDKLKKDIIEDCGIFSAYIAIAAIVGVASVVGALI